MDEYEERCVGVCQDKMFQTFRKKNVDAGEGQAKKRSQK